MASGSRTAGPTVDSSHSRAIHVRAPARLHFGLLNESGLLGRVDGGIGVAVESPSWRFTLTPSPDHRVTGVHDRGLEYAALTTLTRLCAQFDVCPHELDVIESIPPHAGLGSKTALLVALAQALGRGARPDLDVVDLAHRVGRGGTSGVGVHLSEHGGMTVDAGRRFPSEKGVFTASSSSACRPPDLLARLPAGRHSVIHLRFAREGLSGDAERQLFEACCPVPHCETAAIIEHVASRIMPGYGASDEAWLQEGLAAMQGLGLKRHEWEVQDPITVAFREHCARLVPDIAVGLSSMGPTVYMITKDLQRVLHAVAEFPKPPIHLTVTRVSDRGAEVRSSSC